MADNKNVLSNDFIVLLKIYEDTEIFNKPVYYTKLLKEIGFTRIKLDRCLDRLYDKIMIDIKVICLEDGKKVRGFFVSDDFLPFVQGLYNSTVEKDEKFEQVDEGRTL